MAIRLLTVILVVSLLAPVVHAQSPAWPGLWGPARSGSVSGPAAGIAGLREVWRRSITGGYSEVAVQSGLAVTLELRGSDDFVVALDAATGQERWATRIGPTYRGHGGSDDGPISTPSIDGGDVFALGPHGHLLALDRASGKERWRHDLVRAFGAQPPTWGFAASPLVEGPLVIVPAGGPNGRGLLAFDRATGRLIWNAAHTRTASYSSAVAGVIAGVRQIVMASGDATFAVAPDDGRLLWTVPGPGASQEVSNSAILLPNDQVLLTYWPNAVMLKISRDGTRLGASELWRGTSPRASNGPTLYREGSIYGFAGAFLVCLDAATGRERWRERTGEGTLVSLGSEMLLLSQTTGDLRMIAMSPDGYSERHRVPVVAPDTRSVTGISITPTHVYVRNLREMAAFAILPRKDSRNPL